MENKASPEIQLKFYPLFYKNVEILEGSTEQTTRILKIYHKIFDKNL